MSRYNLIQEKWIPVRFLSGERSELGIRDTLLRAKEIESIEDDSPLVVASLHRFLLAVLYRALQGPTDVNQAVRIFREGIPADKINVYLTKWHDRFFLYDHDYPFWQVPDYQPKKWQAWTKLAAEHNPENAKVLFDHTDVRNPEHVDLSKAARWLIAVQTFDLAVAKSEFVQPLDAPSARAIQFIVIGRDLHDTLCFNLKTQAKQVKEIDSALWERKPEKLETLKLGRKRVIKGYSDLYTWQSRSVILEDNGAGIIQQVGFASGVTKSNDGMFVDPMLCYQVVPDVGLVPMRFRQEKDFWREFDSLLPGGDGQVPLVLENAISICRSARGRWPKGILLCGQKTKSGQAKVDFWRTALFSLPQALSGDVNVRSFVHSILETAEDSGDSLKSAVWNFNKYLLFHDPQKEEKKLKREELSQIENMTLSSISHGEYWSSLEQAFHRVLDQCTLTTDPKGIRCYWLESVRDSLKKAWQAHCASVPFGDAWALRAMVKAEGIVRRRLDEIDEEI